MRSVMIIDDVMDASGTNHVEMCTVFLNDEAMDSEAVKFVNFCVEELKGVSKVIENGFSDTSDAHKTAILMIRAIDTVTQQEAEPRIITNEMSHQGIEVFRPHQGSGHADLR